jgi:glyoxylase-like metal-dependent hydrolase (beta-lactamase superfamily II)
MREHFYVLAACVVLATAVQADMSPTRISDRVLIITAGKLDNNMIVLNSKNGLIIIDTFMSPSIAAAARDFVIREFGTNDVKYVVNTHGHWDHFQGNQIFKEATIIGQASIIDDMHNSEEGRKQSLPQIHGRITQMEQELAGFKGESAEADRLRVSLRQMHRLYTDLTMNYEFTPPSLVFEEELKLRLDDMTLRLLAFGGAHTRSDILIHIPEEKMLLVGDVFGKGWLPSFVWSGDEDYPKWHAKLKAVLSDSLTIDHVVPSHGEMMTLEELKTYMRYLNRLWRLVAENSSKGLTLEQIRNRLSLAREFGPLEKRFGSDEGRNDRHNENIKTFWEHARK